MQTLKTINFIISVVFFVCYAYQFLYIPAVLWLRRRRAALPAAPASNHYAILICARNEAAVIGDLLASLRAQTYPRELLTVYVLADNCTDDTARIARERLSMSASTASRSVRATPSRRSSPISRGTSRPDTMATSSLTPITSSPPTISSR